MFLKTEIEDVRSQAQERYPLLALCPGKRPDSSVLCASLCALSVCWSSSTKDSKRCITSPPGLLCSRLNNMMSWEKPQVLATKNILHTADESQTAFQGSWSPLERETRLDSMLPAQLGTHLDMPGGHTFKATKRQELLEQFGQ